MRNSTTLLTYVAAIAVTMSPMAMAVAAQTDSLPSEPYITGQTPNDASREYVVNPQEMTNTRDNRGDIAVASDKAQETRTAAVPTGHGLVPASQYNNGANNSMGANNTMNASYTPNYNAANSSNVTYGYKPTSQSETTTSTYSTTPYPASQY